MAERKYSIVEIDRMRHAIEWSYPSGVCFNGADRARDVEERLRTYMANGTTPEELEKMVYDRVEAEQAWQQKMQAQ